MPGISKQQQNGLPIIVPNCHGQVAMHLHQNTNSRKRGANRYRLIITKGGGQAPTMQVHDRRRQRIAFEWRGAVVRHLLDSGALPTAFSQPGRYACDKTFVWHLILSSAAIQWTLDQLGYAEPSANECGLQQCYPRVYPARTMSAERVHSPTIGCESLSKRLNRLRRRLAAPHKQIAETLFAHPGKHFREEELICLLQLEYLSLGDRRITSQLTELVRWDIIQCIEVDDHNVFYDIDTKPHLHLFDSKTGELRDARTQGIVRVGDKPTTISVQIRHGSGVVLV